MATLEMTFTKGARDKAAGAGGAVTRRRDARYPNLYLEVGTRSKTWRFNKLWKGQNFTETLGTWPQLSAVKATQTAAEINGQVEEKASSSKTPGVACQNVFRHLLPKVRRVSFAM